MVAADGYCPVMQTLHRGSTLLITTTKHAIKAPEDLDHKQLSVGRTALLRVITQRVLVISCRRFGITYQSRNVSKKLPLFEV